MASDANTATTKTTVALNAVRRDIKHIAGNVKFLADIAKKGEHQKGEKEDTGELVANIMLTYRHLEDASMRLGKAIQAHNGGVSVYDTETTVGAPNGPDAATIDRLLGVLSSVEGSLALALRDPRTDWRNHIANELKVIRTTIGAPTPDEPWPVDSKGHAPIGG